MKQDNPTYEEQEAFLRLLRLCYWRSMEYLDGRSNDVELTDRQLLMLRALQEQGPSPPRLICPILGVTPADVTGISDRLAKKGLLRKARQDEDRRVVLLSLTPRGERIAEESLGWRVRRMTKLFRVVAKDQMSSMTTGMTTMLKEIEASRGPGSSGGGRRRRAPSAPVMKPESATS